MTGARARIGPIAHYLPERVLDNEELVAAYPDWSVGKIAAKTGISRRHVAAEDEYSSDLAVRACEVLFANGGCEPDAVDFLILCTQSPDYYLPTTATIVHGRLGLRKDAGAMDINLGCSGYVYSIGIAKGLIDSGQANTVLVVTADTYTKFLNPGDRSVRTIFGDGAAATLVLSDGDENSIAGVVYGSDGAGAGNLVVPNGGLRSGNDISPKSSAATRGLVEGRYDLFMDGPEIFTFTLEVVPRTVQAVLDKAGSTLADIDLFVFHQANAFMLEHLRRQQGIPAEKFFISLADTGNTVSSSIPIALDDARARGRLRVGDRVMLVGFGVGYSWGGLIARA